MGKLGKEINFYDEKRITKRRVVYECPIK